MCFLFKPHFVGLFPTQDLTLNSLSHESWERLNPPRHIVYIHSENDVRNQNCFIDVKGTAVNKLKGLCPQIENNYLMI